jgi:hypothetical protein
METKQTRLQNRFKRLLETTERHVRVMAWWDEVRFCKQNGYRPSSRAYRMQEFNRAILRVDKVYFNNLSKGKLR